MPVSKPKSNRSNLYLVTIRWTYSGKPFTRRIAENGSTPTSAKNKVMKYYGTPTMIKKLGKPTFVTVVSAYSER